MSSHEFVEESETVMRFVTTEDIPVLRAIDQSQYTFRVGSRLDLIVMMLTERQANKLDPSFSVCDLQPTECTQGIHGAPYDASDWAPYVHHDSVPVGRPAAIVSPFARSVFQLPLADTVFGAPDRKGFMPRVTWDLAPLGPARTSPNKPVRPPSPSQMHSTIECPIIDIDNRSFNKKKAAYKTQPIAIPKQDREKLRGIARQRKAELRDPMRGSLNQYESQMFSFPKVNVVHNVGANTESLVATLISSFNSAISKGLTGSEDLLTAFKDAVQDVRSDATTIAETLSGSINIGMVGVTKMLWYVPFIGICYYAITVAAPATQQPLLLAVTTALSVLLPNGLWDHVKFLFPTVTATWPGQQFQSQFSFSPSRLAHVLTLATTFFTIGKKDYMGATKDFLKVLPNYSRTVSGWQDLSSFIVSTIESIINCVRSAYGADRVILFKVGLKLVDNWCSRVMDMMNRSQTGEKIFTPDNLRDIQALRNEGTDLTNMYRLDNSIAPILHKYLGYLDEICVMCSAAMHTSRGGRPPPVVLAITGEPGVGKTFLVQTIASDLLTAIVSNDRAKELGDDFSSEIFQKGASEYWNGYCAQKVVVMDDFGQSVPVPGEDNDYINLIRMANIWPFPLNFADLQNKGKNFFDSDVIILTTNLPNINSSQKVIIEPAAVTRRIDFGYKMVVDPAFAINGKIDMEKVKAYADEHGEIPYHAWQFYAHEFSIGDKCFTDYSKCYTLTEIMTSMKSRLTRVRTHHGCNTQLVKNMVRKRYEAQGGFFSSARLEAIITEACKHSSHLFSFCSQIIAHLDRIRISPTFSVVTSAVFTVLFGFGLSYVIGTVVPWFYKKNNVIAASGLKLNKKNIPDEAIAQMLDVLRPSDFETAVEKDGRYTSAKIFTKDVFMRAYQRLTGPMFSQSNQPQPVRLIKKQVTANRVVETDYETQADLYANSIADVAYNNLYQMRLASNNFSCDVGQILFYADTTAIMPLHFDFELQQALDDGDVALEHKIVLVHSRNRTLQYVFTIPEFMAFPRTASPDHDVVMIKFPRSVRAAKDISKMFLRESDVHSLDRPRVRLDTIDGNEDFIHRSRHVAAHRHDEVRVTAGNKKYILAKGFEYLGYTRKGDCGGVVTLEHAPEKQCRRILGIHVAGEPTLELGISNILTQETLSRLSEALGIVFDKFCESQMGLPYKDAPIEGSFIGQNLAQKQHNMNPTSCIVPTPLHGAWGRCLRKPVPLRNTITCKGPVFPMRQALLPYSTPVIQYDETDVARAVKHAFTPFVKLTTDAERTIYSFEDAVRGIPGKFNGIPRNTSPGYPYVLDGVSNKKLFFGKGDDYEFTSPECLQLRKDVEQIIEDARNNLRSVHVWVDFGKDECRSIDKADEGKMRLISSAPLAYVIVFRMYFLSFTAAVQNTRIRNGVAVGINPYTEWNFLANQLITKGPHCVAGDFKGFDSSEQPDIHWGILDGVNSWYSDSDENKRIRNILWMEVTHSRHLGGIEGKADTVYQWNKSLPSGHPATSVINSFYNLTLFNLVWTDIMGRSRSAEFWTYVYICVYGDDNVLNIDPDVLAKFNQQTISAALKLRGMTYTSETKMDELRDSRSLLEVSFLKRSFRYDKLLRRYVGPQELDSILQVPYWCKNKALMRQITEANIEFTLTELSLHAPEVWDCYANTIKDRSKAIMDYDPKQLFRREEYLNLSLEQDFVWPL